MAILILLVGGLVVKCITALVRKALRRTNRVNALLETFLYWFFYERLGIENVMATLFAWMITVTYAFFTNKIMVYKSKDWRPVIVAKEFLYFFGFRAVTGIFNIVYMYVTVDLLHWWPVTNKAIAALIVGLSNYMFGKKLIFKHRKRMDEIAKDIEEEFKDRKRGK